MIRQPVAALALLAAGCADPGAPVCDDSAPDRAFRVQIGTGVEVFEPIDDGMDLPIIHGPQGGTHLWIAVRIWADAPASEAELSIGARFADTAEAAGVVTHLELALDPGAKFTDRAGLLCLINDPESVQGRALVLSAEASSCFGDEIDERTILPE